MSNESGYYQTLKCYKNGDIFSRFGRKLAQCDNGKGYGRVKIRGKQIMAHRIIWQAFNGPIPKGLEINHKDSNKKNNALSNLELVTKSQNAKHGWAANPNPRSAGRKYLSIKDVKSIKALVKKTAIRHIAEMFSVSRSCISHIKNGRNHNGI